MNTSEDCRENCQILLSYKYPEFLAIYFCCNFIIKLNFIPVEITSNYSHCNAIFYVSNIV